MIKFASLRRTYAVVGGHLVITRIPPTNALRPAVVALLLARLLLLCLLALLACFLLGQLVCLVIEAESVA